MRILLLVTVLMTATPAIAQNQPQGSAPGTPPVCSAMPDRQGHFWSESDWCRWLAQFTNNRDVQHQGRDTNAPQK